MTDIRTKEGREELRRLCQELKLSWTAPSKRKRQGDILFDVDGKLSFVTVPQKLIVLLDALLDEDAALDGLDIAEEMAEHMENHPMTASGKCTRCKVLTRQWRNWKGGLVMGNTHISNTSRLSHSVVGATKSSKGASAPAV